MVMMPLTFSIVFFFACAASSLLGFYILYIDAKSSMNKIFFAICVSLSIWSLGFSIAISAPDLPTCLLWRRISALGWSTLYVELLFFFLILTEKNRLLKKWWLYPLLCSPALVCLYVFAISSEYAPGQYKLVNTAFGWINISLNNQWDWFFYVYYVGYFLLGLGLLWQWKGRTADPKKKQQANLIFYSFIAALFTGTVTDIIGNSILGLNIPQIAPIIIMIPIYAIYYSIKKYYLMNPKPVVEAELILNEANRDKIYNYLSVSFFAGGFLNFISQYLLTENAQLMPVFLSSAFLLAVGLMIQIIRRLKINEQIKFNITVTAIAIMIPVVTLRFIAYASITIWAFPFMFIIISLVFNKRATLIVLAFSIFLTQVLVWINAPLVLVEVNGADHIVRIGLYGIAIWLASYVNNIYILRLKENADQITFQTLISDISSGFVTIDQSNFDDRIDRMLEKCGRYFQAERTNMTVFELRRHEMNCRNEWCDFAQQPEKEIFENVKIDEENWWIKQIIAGQIVYHPGENRDSEELTDDKFRPAGPIGHHAIAVPIVGINAVLGYLKFSGLKSQPLRDDQIKQLKIIANIFADAMSKVNAEKEINYMAYYDHLTNLPNQILFKDRLSQAIHLAGRTEKMIGVIFLDLDAFKTVNDTMGHDGGDELLKKVSCALAECVRKSDTVSRFGGDEFLIMVNNIAKGQDVIKIADSIMAFFKQSFILKGQEFFVTASAGISVYPVDGEDTDTLIKNADAAMYNAKEQGKNQYVLCSADIKDAVHIKMKLTNSLYRALERNELFLQYQPQINLASGRIIGLEALIRWNNPEFGIIPPSVFIPLAEQTGLINGIGDWVLETACRQNKAWQEMGLPKVAIAVNLSVNQFRNSNIVQQVSKVLRETGLDPQYLELEITESAVIRETNYIIGILNELKKIGVFISIDDFGTEYSSLSRLKLLPIDRIKIDIQFIRGIEGSDKDQAITSVIIHLAKNLGLKVIAEGVETTGQIDFLRERMCDEIQGFYFYRPLLAEDVAQAMIDNMNR